MRFGMHLRRALSAAIVAAIGLAVAPAGAAAAPRPELAGTTAVEGARSAVTRVTLPRTARVSGGVLRAFSATGGGRFVGLVLRSAGAPITDTRTIIAGRANFCWTPGCTADQGEPALAAFGFEQADGHYILPAGTYDLYFITDGTPARATLALEGLDGTTVLRPTVPVHAGIESPAPSFGGGAALGPQLYNAGTSNPIGEPGGAIFNALLATGTGPGETESATCIYASGPPSHGVYHNCLGADDPGVVFGKRYGPEPIRHFVYEIGVMSPRNWAFGGWMDAAVVSVDPHFLSVALTYVAPSVRLDPPHDDVPAPPGGQRGPVVSVTGGTGTPEQPGSAPPSQGGRDTTPCRPRVTLRRTTRRALRVSLRSDELCEVRLRLTTGRRVLARAAVLVRPGRATTVRLRRRASGRAKLALDSSDAAGNRSRRTVTVR